MKKILFAILISLLSLTSGYTQGCSEPSGDKGAEVFGFFQPQFDYLFLGEDFKGKSLNEANFHFNRIRVGIKGNVPYDFSYYVLSELSPTLNGPNILDAFVAYNRFKPYLTVAAGQFKSPFGLELTTPCHKLHTINRSQVVSSLAGPFRDMGVMLLGGTGDKKIFGSKTKNFIGYKLAFLNGTGQNTPDNNAKKDIVSRLTIHPIEMLTVGLNYRFGAHPPSKVGLDDDTRTRMGFDVQVKYKGLTIEGEYITGEDKGSYTVGGGCGLPLEILQGSVERNGFFAQAMYKTKWNLEPIIKYESYDPNIDNESIDDIQNIMTLGFNYFPNEWTRLQFNYLYKAEESGAVEIKNDAFLAQVQIVF